MKKIIILLLILIISTTTVMAQPNNNPVKDNIWIPQGLENALLKVEEQPNTNQAMKVLEQNWERFQEENPDKVNRCEEKCDFLVGEHKQGYHQVVMREKIDITFFGFKIGQRFAEETFVFNDKGEILKQNHNVWRTIQKWRE